VKDDAPTPAEFSHVVTLLSAGRHVELESRTRLMAEQYPNSGLVWKVLGFSLKAQGKDALSAFQKATQFSPNDPETHHNLGVVLEGRGQLDAAAASYSRALALKPNLAEAHHSLGNTLQTLGQLDGAVASYHRALAIRPNHAETHHNLGLALQALDQLDAAAASYRQALAIKPDLVPTHVNLAVTLLARGDLPAGWEEFEWRWKTPLNSKLRRDFAQLQWRGEDARGRTLLLHAEHGFGDTLHFCRYATLAAARGLRVIVEVQRPLVRLLRTLPGVDLVIERGCELPAFDLHCSMFSMPLALRTTLATIPYAASYLQAHKAQAAAWQTRLAALPDQGPRIGLVWAGNPRLDSPDWATLRLRSVAPERLAPLFDLPGLHFFSLQKGGVAAPEDFPLTDFMNEMQDFADTAALIANLDLVISVDTAIAHLAAALGKPVWVLNCFNPCWRWLRGRQDSPWYPSLRLFRQPKPGDWQAVIEKVRGELIRLILPKQDERR
jgi:hypothetical protein